ncbi:serine hydrolase domain-containing protein [Paenibacillus sp. FSL W8-0187]|uniref:serine hydrolase domain-containing protein n=1 Tax=Paenibacillus sp. FSL W8-0187 TaxID=2921710 RepID=UPI0030D700E6
MKAKMNRVIINLLISAIICTAFAVPALAEGPSTEQTPSGIPYTRLEQEIDHYVNLHIGKSSPGAAIVVTRGNRIIFSKGYGYADVEKQTSVDPASTVFDYGSINKLFVWTSVMQLVEEGKIRLDEDVRKYFPESFAKKLRYDKPITMLNIMSHTSGFEQHPLALFIKSPENMKSLSETLLSPQPAQIYEPGKVIAYSNYATALAGFAVESLSGKPFYEYEMERILLPLKMKNASGHPTLQDRPELMDSAATGYGAASNGGFVARDRYYVPLYPAGVMKGTAEDLARFAMALTADDSPLFARQQTLQTMLAKSYSPHKDIPSNAHGFWEYNAHPNAIGHAGNTMGFSSNLVVVPEEKLGIVILTNAEVEQSITSGVINLMIKSKETEPSSSGGDLLSSVDVAGHYVLSGNTYSTFQEVISYLGLIRIEAKGEHDLIVNVMGMSGEYKQISPNIYKVDGSRFPSIYKLAPVLYVEKTEGKITRLSKGKATDIVPVRKGRDLPLLYTHLVVAVVAVVFFLLAPIVLFIRWFIQKSKKTSTSNSSSRWFAAVILCGSALVVNVVRLLLLAFTSDMETASWLNFGIAINGILLILAVPMLIISILRGRKYPLSKQQKWFRILSTMLLAGFIILLADWNFYRFIN